MFMCVCVSLTHTVSGSAEELIDCGWDQELWLQLQKFLMDKMIVSATLLLPLLILTWMSFIASTN